MWNWDYELPRNWQPQTDEEWEWFMVRKLQYGDFQGLTKEDVKKYFPKIKKRLDPGLGKMLENFIKHDTHL